MVFSRQIEALGKAGDVAVGFSTSGKSPNVVKALEAARMRGHRPTLRLGGILTNIPDDLGSELLAVLGEAMTNRGDIQHV